MAAVLVDVGCLVGAGGVGGMLYGLIRHEEYILRVPLYNRQINVGILGDVLAGCCGSVAIFVLAGNLLEWNWDDVPVTTDETLKVLALGILAGFGGLTLMHGLSAAVVARFTGEVEDLRRGSRAQAHGAEGTRYLVEEQFALALEAFNRSLEVNPRAVDVLLNKAKALKRLGRPSEALETADKALALDPANDRALYNRACYGCLVYPDRKTENLGHLERAIGLRGIYRTIAEKDPDFEKIREDPAFVALTGSGES